MKKLVSILVVIVIIASMSMVSFADSSNYIRWEEEPNNIFNQATFAIPYSASNGINQGYLSSNLDTDMWWFMPNKPINYHIYLVSPQGYNYNFQLWQRVGNNYSLITETNDPGMLDQYTIGGTSPGGTVPEYCVSVFSAQGTPVSPDYYQLWIYDVE